MVYKKRGISEDIPLINTQRRGCFHTNIFSVVQEGLEPPTSSL